MTYTQDMTTYSWYQKLKKPSWAPPAKVFGPVWTVLYLLIAISFGAVLMFSIQQTLPLIVVLPFVVNLMANLAFTPLQFTLKSNTLASIDIVIVLGSLLWAMTAIFPYAPWILYMQIPYLLWVSFATLLQLTITWMNR